MGRLICIWQAGISHPFPELVEHVPCLRFMGVGEHVCTSYKCKKLGLCHQRSTCCLPRVSCANISLEPVSQGVDAISNMFLNSHQQAAEIHGFSTICSYFYTSNVLFSRDFSQVLMPTYEPFINSLGGTDWYSDSFLGLSSWFWTLKVALRCVFEFATTYWDLTMWMAAFEKRLGSEGK